jgi:MFS family permease
VLSIVMPEEAFLAWGWRVAFLASGVLVAVGMYIRLQIMESPSFTEIKESSSEARVPFAELLRTQPKEAFLSLGTRFAEGVSFNVYGVFVISYITATLKLPMTTALLGVSLAAAIMCVLTPVYGALSDRVGRRPVFVVGAVLFGLFALPSFLLFNTRETVWIVLALVLAFGIIHPAMEGILSSFWSELFDTRVRYTGVSFAYQFSGILASGLTPLIATWLLAAGGGRPWFLGAYMMGAALVTVISLFALPETYRKDIDPVKAPPAPDPEPEPAVKS